jgi:hypothetical protein
MNVIRVRTWGECEAALWPLVAMPICRQTLPTDRQRTPNRGLHQIWRGARRHSAFWPLPGVQRVRL